MLTLKAPIQLHIAQGLTGNTEAFGQKILGNYELLRAKFAPKDLLFLLTAPPELPEELGGMTTLISQQMQVDQRSVTLDVVNHVINRILLDGTSQFTYQDQVYITTVLNRLGITNVDQFMAQVRQLRTESENTVQLTRLYRAELERVLQRQMAGEPTPILPLSQEKGEEQTAPVRDPRTELSLSILQRLETSRLYETIHAFQRNYLQAANHIHRNELRLAEQLRFSNAVELNELKQQFFENPQVQLLHHLNQYESGTILEVPTNEEAVLSQAAVAALVTAVDNTVTEVLNRPQINQTHWVRLQNALWQTAENTISRFETYHSDSYLLPGEAAETIRESREHYTKEAGDYLTLYQQLNPHVPQVRRAGALSSGMIAQLIHLTRQEGDLFVENEGNSIRISPEQRVEILREALQTQAMAEKIPVGQVVERENLLHREILQWEQEHLREIQVRETVTMRPGQGKETKGITLPKMSHPAAQTMEPSLPPMELTPREAEEQAPEALVEELQRIDQHNREVLETVRQELQKKEVRSVSTAPDIRRTMQDALRAMEDPDLVLREIPSVQESAQTIHPMLSNQEQVLLDQADPAARALYERVLLYQKAPEVALAQGLVRPGNLGALHAELQQAAREETLPVLEYVESRVETELLETETILEKFRQMPDQYRRTETPPEVALAEGLVHSGNLGALHTELQQAVREETLSVLKHVESRVETELLETETILEKFRQMPGQYRRVETLPAAPRSVSFVHKQAAPDVTEELLEQLEQQRTRSTVKTETSEEIVRQSEQRTDLKQTEHHVVRQTTEDITELVNRTLARQMRTISDQVYRQMEKKLQTERSRRGRF